MGALGIRPGEQGGDERNGFVRNEHSDRRLVVITDLGLLAKRSIDASQEVLVQSIHTGDPLPDVCIEVLGRNGQPVLSSTSFLPINDGPRELNFSRFDLACRSSALGNWTARPTQILAAEPYEKLTPQADTEVIRQPLYTRVFSIHACARCRR